MTISYNVVPKVNKTNIKCGDIAILMYHGDELVSKQFLSKQDDEWFVSKSLEGKRKSLGIFDDDFLLKQLNLELELKWLKPSVTRIEISGCNGVQVFFKNKKVVPSWKRHGLTSEAHLASIKFSGYKKEGKKPSRVVHKDRKPLKLESKRMKYHSKVNKSHSLAKSCRCMTGDVTVLGKNFKRLI